jgi:C1A family cysteine protease
MRPLTIGSMIHGLGGIRDAPDGRDYPYIAPPEVLNNLPNSADLRSLLPPVYNQLTINSCTGNAIAAAMEFDDLKRGMKRVKTPSRLFIYYNERVMEGDPGKDSGGQIRDGIKSVALQGVCTEKIWPYLKANVLKKPSSAAYSQARRYKAIEYQRISHKLDHMKSCLASGYPFVFGIKVFTSFQGATMKKTGELDMPRKHEKAIGLHAVLAAGYNDKARRFLVRNSWGSEWGMKGYFTIPYDYLLDAKISHDFWTIRFVT